MAEEESLGLFMSIKGEAEGARWVKEPGLPWPRESTWVGALGSPAGLQAQTGLDLVPCPSIAILKGL